MANGSSKLDLPAVLNRRLIIESPENLSRSAPSTPTSEAVPIRPFASKLELSSSQPKPFSYTASNKAPSSPSGDPPARPFASPSATSEPQAIPQATATPVTDSPPKKMTRKQTPGRLSADVPKSPPMVHIDSPQLSSSAPANGLTNRKVPGILPPLLLSQDPHKSPILLAPSASVQLSADEVGLNGDKKLFRRSRSVGSITQADTTPAETTAASTTTTTTSTAVVVSPREKKSFRLRFLRK